MISFINKGKLINMVKSPIAVKKEDSSHIEVEYIKSTGTQYIETNYTPNSKTRIEIEVSHCASSGVVFSASTGWDYGIYCLTYQTRFRWMYPSDFNFGSGTADNKNKIVIYRGSVNFNDSQIATNETTETIKKISTLHLMGENRFNDGGGLVSGCRLYKCKIYEDDTLLFDFVPVYTKEGVYALYDKVSKTYFYNAGTGAFRGPYHGKPVEVEKINLHYKLISLNYSMTNNTKIELKVNALQNTAWANVLNNDNGYYLQQNSYAYGYTFGYNNNFVTREISINWNSNPKILIFDNNKIYVDGTLVAEGSDTNINTNNAITVNAGKISMDFYYMKIYENNELVHNYIPREYTDGTTEIYDTITKTSFEI